MRSYKPILQKNLRCFYDPKPSVQLKFRAEKNHDKPQKKHPDSQEKAQNKMYFFNSNSLHEVIITRSNGNQYLR